MIGRIEEQDLRRRDDERPFQHAATFGHAFFQPPRQRLADRAEPAQRAPWRSSAPARDLARRGRLAQREVCGEALFEGARQGQRFGDRARRGDPRRHARRRRVRRFGPAGMISTRLSSQRPSPRIRIVGPASKPIREIRGRFASRGRMRVRRASADGSSKRLWFEAI